MASINISLKEEAYQRLEALKRPDESFSDEIRRILSQKRKKSLKDFFGILSEEEGEAMMKGLERSRNMDMKLKRIK